MTSHGGIHLRIFPNGLKKLVSITPLCMCGGGSCASLYPLGHALMKNVEFGAI